MLSLLFSIYFNSLSVGKRKNHADGYFMLIFY